MYLAQVKSHRIFRVFQASVDARDLQKLESEIQSTDLILGVVISDLNNTPRSLPPLEGHNTKPEIISSTFSSRSWEIYLARKCPVQQLWDFYKRNPCRLLPTDLTCLTGGMRDFLTTRKFDHWSEWHAWRRQFEGITFLLHRGHRCGRYCEYVRLNSFTPRSCFLVVRRILIS